MFLFIFSPKLFRFTPKLISNFVEGNEKIMDKYFATGKNLSIEFKKKQNYASERTQRTPLGEQQLIGFITASCKKKIHQQVKKLVDFAKLLEQVKEREKKTAFRSSGMGRYE